jgi:hypothetical protein
MPRLCQDYAKMRTRLHQDYTLNQDYAKMRTRLCQDENKIIPRLCQDYAKIMPRLCQDSRLGHYYTLSSCFVICPIPPPIAKGAKNRHIQETGLPGTKWITGAHRTKITTRLHQDYPKITTRLSHDNNLSPKNIITFKTFLS